MAQLITQRPFITHGPISGPYHTGAYIQTGGNVFKWLGHMARSVLFPYIKHSAKKVANSDTVKHLAQSAKKAAVSGAIDASTKILKGENVKESILSAGKKTGSRLKRSLNKEANKIGQKIVEATEPAVKKKKNNSTSQATLKSSSRPSYSNKRGSSGNKSKKKKPDRQLV